MLEGFQFLEIEGGKYPQNLQRVPAVLIEVEKQQTLLQGREAFVWLNDKKVSALHSENTSGTQFSFLVDEEKACMADRVSTPFFTEQQQQQQQQQGARPGFEETRFAQGPQKTQEAPGGLRMPEPISVKNNAQDKVGKDFDELLAERNMGISMPPRRM